MRKSFSFLDVLMVIFYVAGLFSGKYLLMWLGVDFPG